MTSQATRPTRKLRGSFLADAGRCIQPHDDIGLTVFDKERVGPFRKVLVRPHLEDDWAVVANQWAMGIGRPGVMKSPAMDELRELGATDVVVGIEQAQGRFGLILEFAGGASLATALHAVDANGAVVVFGNSSGEMTTDFRGGQNARLQSFFSFTSGPEEQFAPDLALLVSLVADKSLTPQTGPERNWRDIARVADELRDRRVGGKAVFRVEP